VKMFDTRKTRMIGLSCGEETDNMLSRFDRIPERGGQTDRRTGGQADRRTESLYQCRASVCRSARKIVQVVILLDC